MKRLYFARHGESLVNVRNIFATKLGTENDLGLTETGRQQAAEAGQKAADEHLKPDLIISSPLPRAVETAEIIAHAVGYPVEHIETSPLLIEIQYGELEGTPWQAFWDAGHTYADLGKFAGSETVETLQQRANEAYKYLQSLPQERILVVSHSGFGRALRRAVRGQSWEHEFSDGGNTSLPHGEILKFV
jgi:probable phosphoglycerate mutase